MLGILIRRMIYLALTYLTVINLLHWIISEFKVRTAIYSKILNPVVITRKYNLKFEIIEN